MSEGYNFAKFPKLKSSMIADLDTVLSNDIPQLMAHLPHREEEDAAAEDVGFGSGGGGGGGMGMGAMAAAVPPAAPPAGGGNPFATSAANPFGAPAAAQGPTWVVEADKPRFKILFDELGPSNGKLDGGQVMGSMQETGCATDSLRIIWELADIDKDGFLDLDEFSLAMWLCTHVAAGNECPMELQADMVPPSKR